MKIAVDAFPLAVPGSSGIPNYVRNVLLSMLRLNTADDFFLYCRDPFQFTESANLRYRFRSEDSKGSPSYGSTIWLYTKGMRLMKNDGIDLFWGPRHMLPPALPKKIKTVLTVHDLVWRYYPETMENYNLLIMKLIAGRSIRNADHIIAVSNATAMAIKELYGIRDEKITVIHHGVEGFTPLNKDESARYISEKYGTSPDYLLAVGTLEPRKNLQIILRALSQIRQTGYQLLVAGISGWKTWTIFDECKRLNLSGREVKFLGNVPAQDMNRLFSGAKLFLFPSIYEGFGIPPLEAMASGTPVIASNSSSVPEVVGNAGLLLYPHDAGQWKDNILGLLGDPARQEEMIRLGLERAALFTWKKSALKTMDVFRRASEV